MDMMRYDEDDCDDDDDGCSNPMYNLSNCNLSNCSPSENIF
jgi:hypothetical protein